MYGQVFMLKIVNVFERHAYSFEELSIVRIKRVRILSSKIRQYFRPEKVHNFY